MLSEGSELMFSKQGHDNSYDRPDLNQIDWSNSYHHKDLLEAVVQLIALRKRFPHFHYTRQLRQRDAKKVGGGTLTGFILLVIHITIT